MLPDGLDASKTTRHRLTRTQFHDMYHGKWMLIDGHYELHRHLHASNDPDIAAGRFMSSIHFMSSHLGVNPVVVFDGLQGLKIRESTSRGVAKFEDTIARVLFMCASDGIPAMRALFEADHQIRFMSKQFSIPATYGTDLDQLLAGIDIWHFDKSGDGDIVLIKADEFRRNILALATQTIVPVEYETAVIYVWAGLCGTDYCNIEDCASGTAAKFMKSLIASDFASIDTIIARAVTTIMNSRRRRRAAGQDYQQQLQGQIQAGLVHAHLSKVIGIKDADGTVVYSM
jgi:hypothetical protein